MADLVTRLLLDDKQFDDNIVKSTRQILEFQRTGNKVVGMLGKFAGSLGVAMGAAQVFNGIMRGSQATSDAYDASMRACKTSVNEFFSAISTGNFSAFDEGLVGIINRAKEANQVLDQLANTMISFDLASYDNQMEFDQLMDKWRKEKDSKKKAELYKQIQDTIKTQGNIARTLSNDIRNSIESVIKEDKLYYTGEGVALEQLRDIVKIDANEKTRTQMRNEAIAKEEEFERKKAEIHRKYTKYGYTERNEKTGRNETVWYDKPKSNTRETPLIRTDKAKFLKESKELAKDYQLVFAINKLLLKDMDDTLTETKDLLKQETAAKLSVVQMKRKLHAKDGSYKGTSYNGTPKADKIKETQKEVDMTPVFIPIKFDSQKSLPELEAEKKMLVKRLNNSQTPEDYVKIKAELDTKDAQIADFKTGRGIQAPVFTLVKENPMVDSGKIKETSEYAESLNLVASAMGSISQMTNEGASAWLTWGANIMTSVATAIPAIETMIALKKQEAVANGAAEAAKTPFVGWLTVGAAVAAVAAAMFSIPKFATGGIVGGTSYSGDKIIAGVNSGEMILNGSLQRNLFNLINGGSDTSSRQVEFKIKGNELVGVLNNYNKKMSRV